MDKTAAQPATGIRRQGRHRLFNRSFRSIGIALFIAAMGLGACGAPPPDEASGPVTETPAQPQAETQTAAPAPAKTPPSPKTAPEGRAQPEAATGSAAKKTATARKHMIAAANPLAAAAGRDMLRAGGSAVDAAIAAQMVLNLVEPQSSGIGGGGFMMHFSAKNGEIAAYDGRETAPRSATPTMFLGEDGKKQKFYDMVVGGLSVGVPGLLRMLETAHKEHGKLAWKKLFEPAIRLAEDGFAVSPRLHGLISRDGHLKTFASAASYFYTENGEPLPVGHRLSNKSLARTLRTIAEQGADAFYTGDIAQTIVNSVRSAWRNPSGMTLADLGAYKTVKRDPVCMPYKSWLICGMPPPSSGGLTTLQILGLLQGFDLTDLPPGSRDAVHLIAEAGRLAFADRNIYIADPDFIPVPVGGLLDPGYLELRAREISPKRDMGPAPPGMPGTSAGLRLAPDDVEKGLSTTHISIIDGNGNAVSMTTSIENAFGSRLMTRGFLLNNQLTDFSFLPEKNGAPVANRAEPGKRPRSSMAPTLVFDGSGKVVMAIGSPGGSSIIGYVAKTLISALDWKMNIQDAIDLPHFVNRNGKTVLEKDTPVARLKDALEIMGHEVSVRSMPSGLHGITAFGEGLIGGADPRREGVAIGD